MNNQFEEFKVWKKSHSLVLIVYKITKKFPQDEKYSLTDQLKRAVVSIAANTAEGNTRYSKNEFIHFMYIAKSSLEEVKYYLLLARDLDYISVKEYEEMQKTSTEVGKLINGFIRYLKLRRNIKYDQGIILKSKV